jgi:hypothetical protein
LLLVMIDRETSWSIEKHVLQGELREVAAPPDRTQIAEKIN